VKTVALFFCLSAFAISGDDPLRWNSEHLHQLSYSKTLASVSDKTVDMPLFRAAIQKALAFWLDLSIEFPRKLTLEEVISSCRVELAELDPNAPRDVIVQASTMQGGCGATGNCPLWIFRRSTAGYKLLLQSQGDRIKILPADPRYGADIVVSFREGGSEQILRVYRLSSGQYRQRACYKRQRHLDGTVAVRDCKDRALRRP
jgi:hypothetical protein